MRRLQQRERTSGGHRRSLRRFAPIVVIACVLTLTLANVGGATVYFVDTAGNDSNHGRSPAVPWQSIKRVSNAELAPGDRVLFKGGASWSEALNPTVSGRRSAPVTFASYGDGIASLNGGIFLTSVRWLKFERLAIVGTEQGVLGGTGGTGSRSIELRALSISDVEIGVNSANPRDKDWLIQRTTIRRTQDSAVIIRGDGFRVEKNTISDAGLGAAIPFAKHGVYVKGPNARVSRNTIRGVSDAGVTTRFPRAVIQWNRISDAETGISYFQNAAKKGRSILRHNTITNVQDGIFLSSSSAERFFVHSNNVTARRNGLHAKRLPGLWVWGNAIAAPDRLQIEGPRKARPPVNYIDPSVPRLATLRSFALTPVPGKTRPRVLARFGCRSVAMKRCIVAVSARVGKAQITHGTLKIRKGGVSSVRMRIRRTAVHADADARRRTPVNVVWTARDAAGRKTIGHATVRVRL